MLHGKISDLILEGLIEENAVLVVLRTKLVHGVLVLAHSDVRSTHHGVPFGGNTEIGRAHV